MEIRRPVSVRLQFVRLRSREQIRRQRGLLAAALQDVVRCRAGDFGHVSPVIEFDDGSATELAFYTNAPEGFLQPWRDEGWIPDVTVRVDLFLEPDERERFWRAAQQMAGRPYNRRAFLFNFVPLLRDCFGTDTQDALICSQAAALALQRARPGTFDHLAPARTSPAQLYRAVMDSGLAREQ